MVGGLAGITAEAEAIAAWIGEHNGLRMHFVPTNVAVWRLGISVSSSVRAAGLMRRSPDTVDRLAPTRVRNDPIARDLVLTLGRRARLRVWEPDSLHTRSSRKDGEAGFETQLRGPAMVVSGGVGW